MRLGLSCLLIIKGVVAIDLLLCRKKMVKSNIETKVFFHGVNYPLIQIASFNFIFTHTFTCHLGRQHDLGRTRGKSMSLISYLFTMTDRLQINELNGIFFITLKRFWM